VCGRPALTERRGTRRADDYSKEYHKDLRLGIMNPRLFYIRLGVLAHAAGCYRRRSAADSTLSRGERWDSVN